MADFPPLAPGVLEGAMQSLLEARRSARAIELIVDGLEPLVQGDHPKELVGNIREAAAKISHWVKVLYDRNAREALGRAAQ